VKTVAGWVLFLLAVIGFGVGVEGGAGAGDNGVISCGSPAACASLADAATPATPLTAPAFAGLPLTSGQFVAGAGALKQWVVLISYGGTPAAPVLMFQAQPWDAGIPYCLSTTTTNKIVQFVPFVLRGGRACAQLMNGLVAVLGVHGGVLYDLAPTLRRLKTVLAAIYNS
jgi:hypothetical protein